MPSISTASGYHFNFENIESNIIDIRDIAAGLSKICRFTGQCSRFYSVAEHCVLGARYLDYAYPHVPLSFLLHDASEAYLGDVSHPLKQIIGPLYKELENKVSSKIFTYFGLDPAYASLPAIKRLDVSMCVTEGEVLMPAPHKWAKEYAEAPRLKLNFKFWRPPEAEWEFLRTFKELFTAVQETRNVQKENA